MSATFRDTMHEIMKTDVFEEHLESLQKKIMEFDDAAAKKDKQISQLTSRMREYEMGEYGLAEAVNEIKDCRRIIRTRDREIEILTDEINALKLQISELKEIATGKSHAAKQELACSKETLSKANKIENIGKRKNEGIHLNKTNQCKLPTIPVQYLENFYSAQLQNESLRIELSRVCKEAIELSKHLQHFGQQNQKFDEVPVHGGHTDLSKHEYTANNKDVANNFKNLLSDCSFKYFDDLHQEVLDHINDEDEAQNIFQEQARQINILKNNELVLIRRYIILSDRETSLRKENLKLRKAVHLNWRKNCDANKSIGEKDQNFAGKHLSPEDKTLLKKLMHESANNCENSTCQDMSIKLVNIVVKLLAEISFLKKLLEISRHQTQAVEAMCFSQEVEMKSLRDQFTLFQAQSDEKMLLGKLAMKVLQLQFNQAACLYELNQYKSNQQSFQDWYSSLKVEYEENGKRFATLYLNAQDKVKHLCEVITDVCQRCNEALTSYMNSDYKLF